MPWDFSTDPDFEPQLAWMREFVAEAIEPLDLLWPQYEHFSPPKRPSEQPGPVVRLLAAAADLAAGGRALA